MKKKRYQPGNLGLWFDGDVYLYMYDDPIEGGSCMKVLNFNCYENIVIDEIADHDLAISQGEQRYE